MELLASESSPALLTAAPYTSVRALLSVSFPLDSFRACSFSLSRSTSSSFTLPA